MLPNSEVALGELNKLLAGTLPLVEAAEAELNIGENDKKFAEDTANLEDDGPSSEIDVNEDEITPDDPDEIPVEEPAGPPETELDMTDEEDGPAAELTALPEDVPVTIKDNVEDLEGRLSSPKDELKAANEDDKGPVVSTAILEDKLAGVDEDDESSYELVTPAIDEPALEEDCDGWPGKLVAPPDDESAIADEVSALAELDVELCEGDEV